MRLPFALLVMLSSAPLGAQIDPLAGEPSEDVVRLEIGGEVRGRIVKETDDYVELRVADGMIVGIGKAQTVAILRAQERAEGARPAAELATADSDAASDLAVSPLPLRTGQQWFALHDGDGKAVGWLHEFVGVEDDGSVRMSEEWRFRTQDGPTEITVLERIDSAGRPASCFYHERVRGPKERVLRERVVRGVVEDGMLRVTRRSNDGSARYEHAFPAEARFPLEMRWFARRQGPQPSVHEGRVYDPRGEDWTVQRFEVGQVRQVDLEGARVPVRVVTESKGAREDSVPNVEWLDGAARPVRREVNGPALVAVPMEEARARALAEAADADRFAPALVAEPEGRFALWLPNPLWRAETPRSGEILARCESFDATMSLVLLDQLGEHVLLPTAADSVERWFRLSRPDVRFLERKDAKVRDARALRFGGEYQVRALGSVTARRCDFVVFRNPSGPGYLSFCADAPDAHFDQLAEDFERALARIEPRREGIRPEAKGPLVRR